jgi:TonB family protein
MRIFSQQKLLVSTSAVTFLLAISVQLVLADDVFQDQGGGSDGASAAGTGAALKAANGPLSTIDQVSNDTLIYERAKSKEKKGDLNGAINDLNSLLEKSPNKPLYIRERARTYFLLKDYQKAMSDIENSLRSEPKNAWALDIRGIIKAALGDFAGAEADDTTAISIEKRPKFACNYYYSRSLVRQKLKNFHGALEDAKAAIAMNPSYAKAYSARGTAEWHLKDYDSAMADYSKAIELDPRFSQAYVNRSLVKFGRSDYKGALADLNKALQISPTDVNALRNRAKTKDALGDADGAIADYNEALRYNEGKSQTTNTNTNVSTSAQASVSSSVGSAAAAGGQQADISRYMAMMQPWIKSFWEPPSSNVAKKALVGFLVDASGNVSEVKIKESSGDDAFDAISVETVKKADPIPAPPASLKAPVPVEFNFTYNVHTKPR